MGMIRFLSKLRCGNAFIAQISPPGRDPEHEQLVEELRNLPEWIGPFPAISLEPDTQARISVRVLRPVIWHEKPVAKHHLEQALCFAEDGQLAGPRRLSAPELLLEMPNDRYSPKGIVARCI